VVGMIDSADCPNEPAWALPILPQTVQFAAADQSLRSVVGQIFAWK
jgi:hypothetical protein